jgi:UDP-2,3-diacylglucosamine hydrolase
MLHPDFGIRMALFWSRKSRYATVAKEKRHEDLTLERIRKRLTAHSKDVMSKHPGLDYLVYGHYHHPVMERIGERTIQVVLGDWLTHFTYAVFDGEKIELVTWDKTV